LLSARRAGIHSPVPPNLTANEALTRLREGNQRFATNVRSIDAMLSQARRAELAKEQFPFAIVLGCSDSRSPAETVFDQGLGDLFVIRVAGNIVASSQIGSVEFAADRYGVRLVVVMGHTRCGAIEATIDALAAPNVPISRGLMSIIDRVRPSVATLLETDIAHDREALARASIRANVRSSVDHLRHGSILLERLVEEEGMRVVGAEYSLESGVVDFFEA
jgi:carbonic anhydrase